ncbi:alpha/beta hydrolase [Ensifer sp. MJa1]|uniref:alpha/beta hydrolase n=1 Tax=Ensifer sp. MJa1 TaxID=2919888 RepID=UPI00300848AD
MKLRFVGYALAFVLVVVAAGYAAFAFSPWPSVLVIRNAFDKDAVARNRALEKHAPPGVTVLRDERYGDGASGLLDVYQPAGTGALPTIVWVHGGAFVAGDRADVAGYLRILSARGYTTVAVGYPLAPSTRYPAPVVEVNRALAFLVANAERLRIDPDRIFLAGDSAGAQIAAQTAAIVSDAGYAESVGIVAAVPRSALAGVVLFCGVYDLGGMNTQGEFGGFLKTVLWSYFGLKQLSDDPRLAAFSVRNHVTGAFPPTFLSVGNADPLAPQTRALAEALRTAGAQVDQLTFPDDFQPPLNHEYQFDLDTQAGAMALERLSAFLAERARR